MSRASKRNRLSRVMDPIDKLPRSLRVSLRSFALGHLVKFVGTAQIKAEELTARRGVFSLRNHRRVQNHIKGVHAAAAALLAETASGLVVGMNVPDDRLPLLKSMKVDYVRRVRGGLRAVATLTEEQIASITGEPRGSVAVSVTVTDDSGREPVECEMVWAWVSKKRPRNDN